MKRPRPTLGVYASLVPRLTYGLYHISGWGGVCLSNISDAKMFATEGPDKGVIETIGDRCCGMFSQDRNGSLSLETPSSHVKLSQAKVERRLTLLCMKGDHSLYDLQFYFLFLLVC